MLKLVRGWTRTRIVMAAAVVGAAFAAHAHAALITVEETGSVHSIADGAPPVAVGDAITFDFSFDTATLNDTAGNGFFYYDLASGGLSINGAAVVGTLSGGLVQGNNNSSGSSFDNLSANLEYTGASDGLTSAGSQLVLPGTTFSSDAFDLSPGSIGFVNAAGNLQFGTGNDATWVATDARVLGAPNPVSEPGSVGLLGAALLALGLVARRKRKRGEAARRAIAVCAVAASAVALQAPAHAGLIVYNGFADTTGLTFKGNATTATTGDGTVLRLTPAIGAEAGAAYSTSPITLGSNATFSTEFQFRISSSGGIAPADGMTFVLAQSPTGLGSSGGGLGYSGVGNSVAIEFDTFANGTPDTSANHVAIDTNGTLADTALANLYGVSACGFSAPAGCLSNGDLWTADITYDGSLLNVTLSDPAEGHAFAAISNYSIAIASYLGTNSAYVGFTASTGGGYENHDIVSWQFATTAKLADAVPEPASLMLLGAGLIGLALIKRRKQDSAPE